MKGLLGVLLLIVAVMANPSVALAVTTDCTGSLSGSFSDINVPDGETCNLASAVVGHDITVGIGSSLTLDNTFVDNDLLSNGATSIELLNASEVQRNVTIDGTTPTVIVSGSTIGNKLTIADGTNVQIVSSHIDDTATISGANVSLIVSGGSTLGGDLLLDDPISVQIMDSTIDNDVVIGNATGTGAVVKITGSTIQHNLSTEEAASVRLINTDVDDNVDISATAGFVIIGDAACKVDPRIGENLTLTDNLGPIAVCHMTIDNDAIFKNNSNRIGFYFNSVGENLEFTGNTGKVIRAYHNRIDNSLVADLNSTKATKIRWNRIGQNLEFTNNTAVWRNVVRQNKMDNIYIQSGNTPPPVGGGNTCGGPPVPC